MRNYLDLSKSRSKKDFKTQDVIAVNDKMQTGYSYVLSEPIGENFDSLFKPQLTPEEMLSLGVFEGKYLNDCAGEFPREWFEQAIEKNKLSIEKPDISKNCFRIKSRQSLLVWREKDWITPDDPDVRGWFQ